MITTRRPSLRSLATILALVAGLALSACDDAGAKKKAPSGGGGAEPAAEGASTAPTPGSEASAAESTLALPDGVGLTADQQAAAKARAREKAETEIDVDNAAAAAEALSAEIEAELAAGE